MSSSPEALILQWFDRALEQPPSVRRDWVAAQSLPEAVLARVLRLVDAESTMGAFLEEATRAPHAADFPTVGERLGSYELLRQIDAGGMGVVFLGKRADDTYDQQVAIKLIRPLHVHAAPEFRRQLIARFETERKLLARLHHPNVAHIIDGGSTESGIPYLVMEYVDGVSLTRYCEKLDSDVSARLRLFKKVCDGVQEAHRHLIVHRDLKPENILVGKDGEPRLLDFGIARTLDEAEGFASGTATALTAMTPAYASPEQVRHEPLTTSSDVYSLGVVLYELLTGRRPYELEGLSPGQAERVVGETEPAPLRSALHRVDGKESSPGRQRKKLGRSSRDLDRIVAKAMHKEAARRYATAQELGADVQRFLDGKPVLAHPDSAGYRIGKFVGRHRIGSAAAALAIAAIVTAAGVAMVQATAARRSADDMREVNGFLMDVLKMSDPFAAGSELTLSQALDGAAETLDDRFKERPDLASEIRFGIGYSMVSRFRLDAAEKQLTTALRESEAAFGQNDIRTLRIVEGIAGLRQEQGRMDEAVDMFRLGIARIEESGQKSNALYGILLGNLGNLELVREHFAVADQYFRKAVEQSATSHQEPETHAALVSNLAKAALGMKDYDRADTLYLQAQAEFQALFPDGNPDQAIVLNNRALVAEGRGDLRASLDLHQQSLAMRRRLLGDDHPMVVVALTSVARMAVAVDDKELALSSAREASQLADKVYTEPNSRHVQAWTALAEAEMLNGHAAASANALLRARQIMATITSPTPSIAEYLDAVRTRLCESPDVAAFGKTCAAEVAKAPPRNGDAE
ncbi:MAG: serine/threonine-protein kinase [Dokdonella sp.]